MVKANFTTKDGTTIHIEGTADEVVALVARFSIISTDPAAHEEQPLRRASRKREMKSGSKAKATGKKDTATSLVAEMIENGSLKKPQGLSEIKKGLEQGGHFFSDAAVATALLRAVKRRDLRRIKKGKAWTYVV